MLHGRIRPPPGSHAARGLRVGQLWSNRRKERDLTLVKVRVLFQTNRLLLVRKKIL